MLGRGVGGRGRERGIHDAMGVLGDRPVVRTPAPAEESQGRATGDDERRKEVTDVDAAHVDGSGFRTGHRPGG